MRYLFVLFATLAVTFGAISLVQSYTANAGVAATGDNTDDDDAEDPFHDCHDDGDDGENPGVVDDPDQEENEEENEFGEVGDTEDMENPYEEDDPLRCRIILPDTQSPSPTPCPSIFSDGADGSDCCPSIASGSYVCLCPRAAGADVVVEGEPCVCADGAQMCLCELYFDYDPNVPDCCVYYGNCQVSVETLSADADCDGEVTPVDAYETLAVLSGFEGSADGCAGGDADCSEAVDAKDTLAILAIVAGLEEAATC